MKYATRFLLPPAMIVGCATLAMGQLPSITEYSIPSVSSVPYGITAGPDGALWFVESHTNKVGRVATNGTFTEYTIPTANSSAPGIVAGPDGALWFTEFAGNKIGRITTAGGFTEYTVPSANSQSFGITAGPDGALWFTEFGANKIGRITVGGVFSEFAIPTATSGPAGIASGPDGALWFTENLTGKIGRVTTGGTITEFSLASATCKPVGIVSGPDGALWFAEYNNNNIGRITTVGAITEYAVPTTFGSPEGIATGPDGALWFTEYNSNKVGRITVSGVATDYALPTANTIPYGIALGPDGALWITESNVSQIARVQPAASGPAVAPVSVSPGAGSATTQIFTFTFTDPAGYSDLAVLDILMNNYLDGQSACYVALTPVSATAGYLYLVDDAGDGHYAAGSPMYLPSSGTLQNNQCSIDASGSSISAGGTTLTLTLKLTFTAGFAGNKIFHMAARSNTQNSGWQALGTWNVPGPAPLGPAVGGMSPGRSTTMSQTYTFTFTDTNGYSDLAVLDILTNSFLDGITACYIAYVPTGPTTGYVYLVDDGGDGGYAAGSPIALSSGGSLQNHQCTINTLGSSASASGNTLTLNLAITFSPNFAGNQVFYLAARNSSTGNSGWQAVGSVTVP